MLTSLADVERNVNLVAASASQPADDSPSSPFESSRNGGRFSAVNNGKELLLLEQHKVLCYSIFLCCLRCKFLSDSLMHPRDHEHSWNWSRRTSPSSSSRAQSRSWPTCPSRHTTWCCQSDRPSTRPCRSCSRRSRCTRLK